MIPPNQFGYLPNRELQSAANLDGFDAMKTTGVAKMPTDGLRCCIGY